MKRLLFAAAALLCGVNVSHAAFEGKGCTIGSSLMLSCTPPRDTAAYAYWSATIDAPARPVEWAALPGGWFMMGSPDMADSSPSHEVGVRSFEMSKTAVTVAQYKECFDAGKCTEPADSPGGCNWGEPGTGLHPINCVTWYQANEYAKYISRKPGFEGARLPTEAEWEYAARSGGKDNLYPWGDQQPSSDRVVYQDEESGTRPVCSKPAGNTEQGLCDMAGNVSQWVRDIYEYSYTSAPVYPPALSTGWGGLEGRLAGKQLAVRGGAEISSVGASVIMRNDYRLHYAPSGHHDSIGIRLARSR